MKTFVIISERHSGCQLLASLLNSNQEILCFGEIFGVRKDFRENGNAVDYVKNTITKYTEKTHRKALGFTLNYIDFKENNWMPLLNEMSKNKWRVIHLTRLNILDRVVSEKLNSNNKTEVRITFDELEFYHNRTKMWQEKTNKSFKNCPLYHMTYEMLIQKQDECCEKIQEFLKVKKQKLSGQLETQKTGGQASFICNYRHLYSQCLTHPIYKKYLTDIPVV